MEPTPQMDDAAIRAKLEEYKKDKNMIVVDAEGDEPAYVVKKFTDEDWDEFDNYIDSHPLFMREIDIDDIDKNEYLQALQAMKYDASAEEILEKLYVSSLF